ncbi:MAG: hypothetical protein S4CHLAM123_05070 [Chlamydiales bacterium]|nr:hypothetical protein [Chlamydiales bacterium]
MITNISNIDQSQVKFSWCHEENEGVSVIDINQDELFTGFSWQGLYERASAHVPYYVVAAALIQSGNAFHCRIYDGLSFYKFSKESKIDPLSREEFIKIEYIFFRCLEFTRLDVDNKQLPLIPSTSMHWDRHAVFAEKAMSEEHDLFFDSLNAAAAAANNSSVNTQLAKSQFLIGASFLNKNITAGIRWIWTSAQLNLSCAQMLLGQFPTNLTGKSYISINFQEQIKWFLKARDSDSRE